MNESRQLAALFMIFLAAALVVVFVADQWGDAGAAFFPICVLAGFTAVTFVHECRRVGGPGIEWIRMLHAASDRVSNVVVPRVMRYVGRPAQRWYAERMKRECLVHCVLYDPSDAAMIPGDVLAGVADVSPGRLSIWGAAPLQVEAVGWPAATTLGEARSAADQLLRAPSRTLTLHTAVGTVKCAVRDWQADWVLSRLGFGYGARA